MAADSERCDAHAHRGERLRAQSRRETERDGRGAQNERAPTAHPNHHP